MYGEYPETACSEPAGHVEQICVFISSCAAPLAEMWVWRGGESSLESAGTDSCFLHKQ